MPCVELQRGNEPREDITPTLHRNREFGDLVIYEVRRIK
jgi:hypothetical protein